MVPRSSGHAEGAEHGRGDGGEQDDDDERCAQGQRDRRDHQRGQPGVEHELVTYPGAPHSFFDRKQEEFADASEDAWRRVLAFVEKNS